MLASKRPVVIPPPFPTQPGRAPMKSGPVQRRVFGSRYASVLTGVVAAALFLAAAPGAVRAQATYDILLKGGRVIDPKNGIDAPMDVAVAARKIAKIAPDIPE